MKTRKVMSCTVSSSTKLVKRLPVPNFLPYLYLGVPIGTKCMFYYILILPGAPIHFICGQLVRDVSTLILQKSEVFLQNVFDGPIKLIEFYGTVENVLEVQ